MMIMKAFLIAAAAGLAALGVLPAVAATDQERPAHPGLQDVPLPAPDAGPGVHGAPSNRPGPGDSLTDDQDLGRHGGWTNRPGTAPPASDRRADWARHVRACAQRYRTYDPRTDRYVVRRGQTAQCRL
jgi:hypothetical protein